MTIITKTWLELLTDTTATVGTQEYLVRSELEEPERIGEAIHMAFENSKFDRERLQEYTDDTKTKNAVFAMWGDTATIFPPEPATTEETEQEVVE